MKRLLAVVTLCVSALCGCGSSADTPTSPATESETAGDHIAVAAAIGYPKVQIGADGKGMCASPMSQYALFAEGSQVLLTDSSGDTVATTTLEAPEPLDGACGWRAFFDDVPRGGKFYTAKLGQFKSQTIPEDELGQKAFAIQP